MKHIGRQINVWFWVEANRGTAVAVESWQPKTNLTFEETMETIQDESSIGVIADSRDTFVVKKFGAWDIEWNIEVNNIWYLLLATLGNVESELEETGVYTHTFELNNSNRIQSLTIWLSDPVIWDVRYPLASIDSFTISANEWEFATFTVSFRSKSWEATTHTVSYDIDYKLLSRYSIFKTAENLAWLDWASNVCLRSFEITFTKNLEDDYCLGSIAPVDFINQQFSIEWSFTAVFTDTEFRAYALNWVKRAIRFELKDTDTTIWEENNPWIKIDLPLCSFTEFSRTQGNDETVVQTLTFKWLYSMVDESIVEVELTNTKEEYIQWS